MHVLSSAPVGGGLREATGLLNISVPNDYSRIDLDEHASEVARSLQLKPDVVALFTAADVANVEHAEVGDAPLSRVVVDATVGVSKPTWAADPEGGWNPWTPGTVNIIVQLQVPLTQAAAVNAVITATEAKTQALIDAEIPGTGTASDAIVIVWPVRSGTPAEVFAGPRSDIGSRIAQATHRAVLNGIGAQRSALDQPTLGQP